LARPAPLDTDVLQRTPTLHPLVLIGYCSVSLLFQGIKEFNGHTAVLVLHTKKRFKKKL
jgi:hypothetical protein